MNKFYILYAKITSCCNFVFLQIAYNDERKHILDVKDVSDSLYRLT